jgi:integrase
MSASKFHKVQNTTSLYRYGSQKGYYARFKIHGKLIVKKLNSYGLTNAKIELSNLKETHGKVKPAKGKISLVQAAENYLASIDDRADSTILRARGIVAKLKEWEEAHQEIGKIKHTAVKAWISRTTKDLSKDSYNKHLGFLQQVFAAAVKDRRLVESPLAEEKTKVPDDPERLTPTWKEGWAVIKNIRAQTYNADAVDSGDFVEFMLLSGLGNGEAACLFWSDIYFAAGMMKVTRLKTRKKFDVPLFPSLRKFLLTLPKNTPDGRVMTIANARRAISGACERLKLPHFTQRSFRRCFITRAVEKGVDFKTIAGWQGHQDGGVLIAKTYSHLRNEHSQKMAQRI